MLEIDPSLGWVFDTGGLPVCDQLGQSPDGWYPPHMFGTWGSDAVKGSLTQGDGWINSLSGDDVVYSTDRNEHLLNQSGDALLVAGGGNDTIWAGDGSDILDGGTGDDLLLGEQGDDIYLFRPHSGHDIIRDIDSTPGNVDTIWLGGNLTLEDISLTRVANNLVLKIIDTSDTITVEDFFRFDDSSLKRVEQIQFMDGTTWSETEMIERTQACEATDGPDTIYGGPGADEISGGLGGDVIFGLGSNDTLSGDEDNDQLYGGFGPDVLEGGLGADRLFGQEESDILVGGPDDDYLDGGSGNDTYRFSPNFGKDIVYDMDTTPENIDTIEFQEGILPSDVAVTLEGTTLVLTIANTNDSVRVIDWLENLVPMHGIELITFADGTTWDTESIQDMLIARGTEGNDYIIGFSRADTIEGFGGDDTLYGRGGDDFIAGGFGADKIYGEEGDDDLRGGDGADTLAGGPGDDI